MDGIDFASDAASKLETLTAGLEQVLEDLTQPVRAEALEWFERQVPGMERDLQVLQLHPDTPLEQRMQAMKARRLLARCRTAILDIRKALAAPAFNRIV